MLIGISCALAGAAAICCVIFGYYWIALSCILLESSLVLGILLYKARQEAEVYFVGDFNDEEQKEIVDQIQKMIDKNEDDDNQ